MKNSIDMGAGRREHLCKGESEPKCGKIDALVLG